MGQKRPAEGWRSANRKSDELWVSSASFATPQYFVTATWQLGALRVADGFALGAMLPSGSAILAGLVPAEKRGAAYGVSAACTFLRFAAGPLTSAAIVAVASIRTVFLSAAVLLAVISLWVMKMVPPDRKEGPPTVSALDALAD